MSTLLDMGKSILGSQPFSQLLGAQLIALEAGYAELALPIRAELKQQHGFVHGGAISYLADNSLTYAGGSVLGNCVTSEYKINYVRPALGDKLLAKASVLSTGKRQAVCECKIYSIQEEKEILVAVAQGTIHKIEHDLKDSSEGER